MVNKNTDFIIFWKNKKIFLTGHTGFKGSWLSLYLSSMGAKVYGYSLQPPTSPDLFTLAGVENTLSGHKIADIRHLAELKKSIDSVQPDILIHMAAQPLVRDSYKIPVETYEINVMGTVNVLEAARNCESIRTIVNVTTDKVYENKEWVWPYRENDMLGGYDPYSNSKACSELVTSSYISSYFNPKKFTEHGKAVATARAGNVIGGGDFATDRLIPDVIRSFQEKKEIIIRNPHAIRPWQHVLEPLTGYLFLAKALYEKNTEFTGSWNFGPEDSGFQPVSWLVENLVSRWDSGIAVKVQGESLHEASILKLDCAKAKNSLSWKPLLDLPSALDSIIEWTRSWLDGADLKNKTIEQIENYKKSIRNNQ